MPPLPPGFKIPPGMTPPSAPPMPPGMVSMPPNLRVGGPPAPGLQTGGGGAPPAPMPPVGYAMPPGRYPQPPAHLIPGPRGDVEQGFQSHPQQHMMPPGVVRNPNEMYAPRDDRRPMMPPGADPHAYPPSSYPQGPYGGAMGHGVGDHRGGHSHRGRRDDELREPTNTVWVGNLDLHEHNEDTLRRVFSEFGRVIRVARVPDKSYCFVHFRYVEEARNAVEALSARGSLGRARFNYGKMFEYTQEELEMPRESNSQRPSRRGREDDRHDNEDRRRRPRRDEERMEPTNVLWLGDLPQTVSNEELNENFKVFGNIKTISRLDSRNMAFIHFETIEECTQALDLMRDQPIGGARVVLNYGRAQRNPAPADAGLTPDGIPLNETPTNVVYLGQLASDVTEGDIEDLFEPFEGFINSKFIQSSGIAFGHFDSIEHARVARVALNNALLKGAPLRISFGKSSHSMTMADRMRRGKPAPLGHHDDAGDANAMAPPLHGLSGATGALVAGPGVPAAEAGAMVSLPAMGVMVGSQAAPPPPTFFTRERPTPEMTLDARLQSLLGATYNNCGEAEKALSPSVIQAICDLVDGCVDEPSEKRLDDTIFLYTPLNSSHVFGILTKRMHDYFNDDPHKKLLILYAATRVLLGAKTDYLFFSKAALNAYLMTLFVASEGQTPDGVEMLTSIIENVHRNPFIERQRLDADFIEVFREQLEEIRRRAKVEQDLASLLTKRRRK
ncbi:putative RNA-binding protein [Trypanosoma conorhini]|uniref:Putative RNA-binding protein n=1 Tax=Trypanosoma conorhini TaxID=83891 RepID=A0A422PDE7_9TRYP|nr:putative RNA-binding protein [Trypanosoma conorhini]RNF15734.1 putative RNA-binding protein [Trypanosoma conorhini]